MDVWVSGIFTILSTVIGVVLTHYFTNKAALKANEVELKRRDEQHENDLEQARAKYQHELEVIKINNRNEIKKLKAEFESRSAFDQQQSTFQMAQGLINRAVSGDLSGLNEMAHLAVAFDVDKDGIAKKIGQLASKNSRKQRAQELVQARKSKKR